MLNEYSFQFHNNNIGRKWRPMFNGMVIGWNSVSVFRYGSIGLDHLIYIIFFFNKIRSWNQLKLILIQKLNFTFKNGWIHFLLGLRPFGPKIKSHLFNLFKYWIRTEYSGKSRIMCRIVGWMNAKIAFIYYWSIHSCALNLFCLMFEKKWLRNEIS